MAKEYKGNANKYFNNGMAETYIDFVDTLLVSWMSMQEAYPELSNLDTDNLPWPQLVNELNMLKKYWDQLDWTEYEKKGYVPSWDHATQYEKGMSKLVVFSPQFRRAWADTLVDNLAALVWNQVYNYKFNENRKTMFPLYKAESPASDYADGARLAFVKLFA